MQAKQLGASPLALRLLFRPSLRHWRQHLARPDVGMGGEGEEGVIDRGGQPWRRLAALEAPLVESVSVSSCRGVCLQ